MPLRRKAKEEGKTRYLFDSDFRGFGALATKTGSCSYFVEYRPRGAGGSPKRVTLGKHGALTPDQARQLAREELGKVARGADIAQERKDKRAQLKAGTFRDLSESYFAANGKQEKTGEWKSRHSKETQVMLDKLVYPTLGSKAPDAITRPNSRVWSTKRRRTHIPSRVACIKRSGLCSGGLSRPGLSKAIP
jgi:hypothetical protein